MTNRIGHQVILAVAVASSTIFGLSSYYLLRAQTRALTEQVEHQAHLVSETIKSSTRYAMLLNRREDVHQIIDTIGEQREISQVRIFNKEGRIIYSPDKGLLGDLVDKRAEACYACHAADRPLERLSMPERTRIYRGVEDERHLGIINPIYNEASCWQAACHAHAQQQSVLGILDVTLSLREVDRELAVYARRSVLLTLTAILAISFIIWLFFHRRVARPVARLLDATSIVASGDLSHELTVRRNDELGQLETSFNEMTRGLAAARNQVYRSDRLASLGRLAAGVAHEINNPLTGVLVNSSFLSKRAPAGSEEKDDLETIVRETKRCRDIVKGLLDFARQAPMKRSTADCNEIVQRALKILDNQLNVQNISVTQELAADLPPVYADDNQIVQVLINLLVNAADAIGSEGGTILVSTTLVDSGAEPRIHIEVTDSGIGIEDEDLDKIFELFFSTKDQRGTGLGLAVAWGIVQEHGGTIEVTSRPGRGTTFTLELPILGVPGAVESSGARDA